MRRLILATLCLAAPALSAQTPGSCSYGTAQGDLATPDLFARVFNTGSLFFGNDTVTGNGYLVPRASGRSPLFAASLWVGGTVGGEVRTAAARYGGYQYWPGPLDAGAALPNPQNCAAYDRIWVVSPDDVVAYEGGAPAAVDLREWPVGLGAPAVDAEGLPVPVGSRDQRIDLPGGERPVLGSGPTAFWVMNDVGGVRNTGAAPVGIEVQVLAFAVSEGPARLRQSTFYRYTVVNRNAVPIENLHVGFFADPDLGGSAGATENYVGSDPDLGLGYVYASDNTNPGYPGQPPPALGFDLFSGLYASSHIVGSGVGNDDPGAPSEFYARLRGLWNDETTIREYGDGYAVTQGAVTRYTYTGDPVTGAFWSERNPGVGLAPNIPNDRRFMTSASAATLAPGEARTVDLGVLFAQGADHLQSVTALRSLSDAAQTVYDTGALFSGPLPEGTVAPPALVAPAEDARFYEADVTFSWSAVPDADVYVLEVSPTADFAEADLAVVDGTSVTFPVARFLPNRAGPFYWRVRTGMDGLDGPPSPARTVRVYRYAAAPLALASGAPAYVETTAPGGAPACDGPADADEGCAEVGGDLVFESPNSTGDYLAAFLFGGETSPSAGAPSEFEVRFTAEGSYAFSFPSINSTRRLFEVPFEVWDVGVVAPGTANDPSDDRQLIARVGGSPLACTFAYDRPSVLGVGPATREISAYYVVDDDYAAFATLAAEALAADPAGCAFVPATSPVGARLDRDRAAPFDRLVFEQASARTPADLAGSTVRLYTVDPLVAAEVTPAPAALALGAPFPNPAAGRVTVPYTVAAAGPVRLRLVDVLGRTVAVLAEGDRAAGAQEARLDAGRLAAGVYAVVLDGAGGRAVRTLTVVR